MDRRRQAATANVFSRVSWRAQHRFDGQAGNARVCFHTVQFAPPRSVPSGRLSGLVHDVRTADSQAQAG